MSSSTVHHCQLRAGGGGGGENKRCDVAVVKKAGTCSVELLYEKDWKDMGGLAVGKWSMILIASSDCVCECERER